MDACAATSGPWVILGMVAIGTWHVSSCDILKSHSSHIAMKTTFIHTTTVVSKVSNTEKHLPTRETAQQH